MLMVILGAGASYDSSPDNPPNKEAPNAIPERPPLANRLFSNVGEMAAWRMQFPDIFPLISELQGDEHRSVEQALEKLDSESATNPLRVKQLTAIRFYLKSVFTTLIPKWLQHTQGVTNYLGLLDQISNHHAQNPGPVLLVTFNYDTLIEHALGQGEEGQTFNSMADYVSGDKFRLYKLHGSSNWGRVVKRWPSGIQMSDSNKSMSSPEMVIKYFTQMSISDDFQSGKSKGKSGLTGFISGDRDSGR
jgi:hypothetical protein